MNSPRLFLSLLLCLSCSAAMLAQNVTQIGNLPYSNTVNDVWGYDAPGGEAYALVGVADGFSIVDVSDPTAPNELHFVSGPSSTWRDIKVWGDYAYVVHDGTGDVPVGLLIVDMSNLPATIDTVTIRDWGSGIRVTTTHNVFMDENGILYMCGVDYGVGGVLMLDVATDQMNPSVLGVYDLNYVHDLFVRNDTMWTAEIYTGSFAVVDITDKSMPSVFATAPTPTFFTHNLWLDANGEYLYTTDEVSGGFIGSFDVTDLTDIQELDRFRLDPAGEVIPHNTFVVGNDHIVTSHYTSGVVVHNVSSPDNMVVIGEYDTSPLEGSGFGGCWGVYPYPASGYVYASDGQTGLHILDVNYTDAAYLEGTVTEMGTGAPIPSANVEIVGYTSTTTTDGFGTYKTGASEAATVSVEVSALGYASKTIDGVSLTLGAVELLDVELEALPVVSFSGSIVELGSTAGIDGAPIMLVSDDYTYEITSDASGNFTLDDLFGLEYEVIAAKWGYKYLSQTIDLTSGGSGVTLELEAGYEDAFALDLGWLDVGGTWLGGSWEIAVPEGFDLGYGYNSTPSTDADDIGNMAFITGAGGGFDLIHAGASSIFSPQFDARGYDEPVIQFKSWVFNQLTDGSNTSSNDGLIIKLTDGVNTVTIDTLRDLGGAPTWQDQEIVISEYLEPGATMKIIFEARADGTPFDYYVEDLLEAAVDDFRVAEQELPNSIVEVEQLDAVVYPNPVQNQAQIRGDFEAGEYDLMVMDLSGKLLSARKVISDAGLIVLDAEELPNGLYIFEIVQEAKLVSAGKFSVVK